MIVGLKEMSFYTNNIYRSKVERKRRKKEGFFRQ